MSQTLRQIMPPVYDRLLPSIFDEPAPEEPKATCRDCPMCPPEEPIPGVTYFLRDTKCCTYEPHLPNYLVGAILSDPDPAMAEGQRRIRAHIATRVGVTSRWLAPSRKRSIIYLAARDASFGRSATLRCPYFSDEGLCTVWRHRESVCNTWFCKYASGVDGQAFWKAVKAYLYHVELALAFHAIEKLAPNLVEPRRPFDQMSIEDLEDRPPNEQDYATFWGDFQGREEELYRATFDLVAGMSRDELDAVVGAAPPQLAALEGALKRIRAPVLPKRLRLTLLRDPIPVKDGFVLSTYSKYEPIHVTPSLMEVVRQIRESETVDDFRGRVLRDHEVEVPEELLLGLYQLRVLTEPDTAAEGPAAPVL